MIFFFDTESKSKFFCFFFGGEGDAVDGWTDEQTQTSLPLQLTTKLGA